MPSAETLRPIVAARAGHACEYCRLLEFATGVTFHVEHVIPQSHGGQTNLSNLALSCPGCNLAKADRTQGTNSDGALCRLFNPRDYEPWLLGWHLHFEMDRRSGLIPVPIPAMRPF
jgi:hypothetical protein